MLRFSAKPFLAVFFVLASFVLISSASCAYDAQATAQQLVFSEDDLVTVEEMARMDRATRFVGDLTVGRRLAGESIYNTAFTVYNSATVVNTTTYYYTVPRGSVHYLSVLNDVGSYAAICDFPYTLGATTTYFSVRTMPQSTARLNLLVAAR